MTSTVNHFLMAKINFRRRHRSVWHYWNREKWKAVILNTRNIIIFITCFLSYSRASSKLVFKSCSIDIWVMQKTQLLLFLKCYCVSLWWPFTDAHTMNSHTQNACWKRTIIIIWADRLHHNISVLRILAVQRDIFPIRGVRVLPVPGEHLLIWGVDCLNIHGVQCDCLTHPGNGKLFQETLANGWVEVFCPAKLLVDTGWKHLCLYLKKWTFGLVFTQNVFTLKRASSFWSRHFRQTTCLSSLLPFLVIKIHVWESVFMACIDPPETGCIPVRTFKFPTCAIWWMSYDRTKNCGWVPIRIWIIWIPSSFQNMMENISCLSCVKFRI